MKARDCATLNCENILSPRSQLDRCATCRATMHRWEKRRPAEIIERRAKLGMYSDRMDHLGAKRR